MSVIEKLSVISDTITKVMNFVLSDEIVKPDFDEYLATLSAKNADPGRIQVLLIPYIFSISSFWWWLGSIFNMGYDDITTC